MPRIYKGDDVIMKLLVHTCVNEGKISDLKIALYTTDPNNAIEFTDRFTLNGSILTLSVPNYAFGTMEDGVIRYIAQGLIDDDTFYTERQSNYFLKTPTDYIPTEIPEEVLLETIVTAITQNGPYTITPSEGYNGIEKVDIDVNVEGGAVLSKKIDTPTIESVNFDNSIVYVPEEGVDGFNRVVIYVDNLKAGWYEQGYEDGKSQGGGECNLQDKWVYPSMSDRDENGLIVVDNDSEYDGLDRVVINPDTIYNEGYEQGKSEGGGGCNLEDKIIAPLTNEVDGNGWIYVYPNEGYDGMKEVALQTGNLKNDWYNEVKNGLSTLKINDSIPTNEGVYDVNESVTYEVNVLDVERADYIFVNSEEEKNYLRILFSTFSNKEVQLEKETLGRFGEYYLTYNDGGIRIEGLDLGNLPYREEPHFINEVIITPTYFKVNGNRQELPINLFELMGYNTWLEVGPFDNTIISVSRDKSIHLHLNHYNTGAYIDRRYMDFKAYDTYGWNRVELNLESKWVTPTYDDIDNNGLIIVEEDNEYVGMSRVVIDPSNFTKNARVLEVTENGSYYSKFSDIPTPENVTGVYDDETEFYNYAKLTNKIYNTNITPTPMTRLEFWYKGDNIMAADAWNNIIGAGKNDNNKSYFIRYYLTSNSRIQIQIGNSTKEYDWDENAWHHILIAKETESDPYLSLWIDGVILGNFGNVSLTTNSTFYINGIESNLVRPANGCFGMIKIDDTTIIPTKEGFLNVNTGELLEVIKDGVYKFVENVTTSEGPLFKTVNVNIQPKINVEEAGLRFGYSTFDSVPNIYDFEGITSLENLFRNCDNLQSIPQFDTSKVITMRYAFYNCGNLKTIPQFDTSRVTTMYYTFNGCGNLKTIPQFDTSKVTTMYYAFGSCTNLQSIPKIDCSSIDTSSNSTGFFGSSTLNNLTDIGGFENLKISSNGNYGLVRVPNLTYESCINILNGLYDFTGNGETPNSSQGKLKVHQNFLNLVGEEISIGTNKGWTITA